MTRREGPLNKAGGLTEAEWTQLHLHQPTVKVISDGKGGPLETPVTLDLADSERVIVRTTDVQKYGIRVSDYLIWLPPFGSPPPHSIGIPC